MIDKRPSESNIVSAFDLFYVRPHNRVTSNFEEFWYVEQNWQNYDGQYVKPENKKNKKLVRVAADSLLLGPPEMVSYDKSIWI